MTLPFKQLPFLKEKIHFIDLLAQQKVIREKIENAIKKVLDHGIYIMGPEVINLEEELKKFSGAKYAISCSNGTDAIAMGLRTHNIGPGDAIFVPSFTFAATAEVVTWFGATPVFIDILPATFNIDPESLKQGILCAKEQGLKIKGIIAVDLFGQPADYTLLEEVAQENNLWILGDAAQSFGAMYKGRKVGTLCSITTTSFFPAKPLGCYGDGGAVFTDDDQQAKIMRSIRVHGQGSHKYENIRIGMNGRLDTLQAAILLEKLAIFPQEIEARKRISKNYDQGLRDIVQTPQVLENCSSVWAQYTIVLKSHQNRSLIMEQLKELGIPTFIYYVKALHRQKAYEKYLITGQHFSYSEYLADHVLSLPMHPYLTEFAQNYVIEKIREILN